MKTQIQKEVCNPSIHQKQPQSPLTDDWMKKIWGVCVCVCARTQFWGNAAAVKPSLHDGPPGLGSSPLRWRGFGKVEAAVGLWL